MSSHHIVREKQEPALLILNLEGFNPENLGQLLEWSPVVIVSERMYETVDSMGIKIDGVVTSKASFALQTGTELILTRDKPLQDALQYLAGQQHHAVNIIDSGFVLKEYAFFADRLTLVIYTPSKRIICVKPGFSKWKAAGERIEILSDAHPIQTAGLVKLGEHSYRTEKDGFYTLGFEQSFIFVAEEL